MKIVTFVAILLISSNCFSQQSPDGKIVKDTLFLDNGAKFVIGEKVKLGYGSNANKGFEFVHLSPWSIAGPEKLGNAWANHEMLIKGFKYEGTKKTGKIFYLVLGGGNLSPYWCEIKAAMEQGEVIVQGINDKKSLASSNSQPVSVADELAKLNKLYKDSIITKEEYEAQKKKLLGQ